MDLKTSPEIKCGEMILKLELGEPSESAKEKALKELRETPENRENGLKELKHLLEGETNLKVPMTDEYLIKFLRRSKFYPESALNLIKRYYKILQKYPEVKTDLVPKKLKHVFEQNLVSLWPHRDQYGRRIIISRTGEHWNEKIISVDELYRCSTLCTEATYLEPETHINGIVYIIDLKNLSFSQTLKFTPYSVMRLLQFIQDNIPVRVKGLHLVNQPRIFQPIFKAAKPFFLAKYKNRILMHGSNYKSLHQYILPEYLPKCYGGTLDMELIFGRETYQVLEAFEKYFESLLKYGFVGE